MSELVNHIPQVFPLASLTHVEQPDPMSKTRVDYFALRIHVSNKLVLLYVTELLSVGNRSTRIQLL